MNRWKLALVLGITILTVAPRLRAADSDEEQKLISVLQSKATAREKDAACARLKIIGTDQSVPALAALLTDEELSHSARYALEAMKSESAGRALIGALARTHGLVRAGIVNSLGMREEAAAVPGLVPLLRGANPAEANAAAYALGRIGGTDALRALRAAARGSSGPRHVAAIDGLLRCAGRMLETDQRSAALAAFEQLGVTTEPEPVRIAAFRGRVRSSGNGGLDLVLHALAGPDGPELLAAVQLVHELPMPETTRQVSRLLPQLRPSIQAPTIDALAQRGDAAALPALLALAHGSAPEVQLAIVNAFDLLGDASVIAPLATFASSGAPQLQPAARRALADIHRGNITDALLQQLGAGSPDLQAEIARALGARGDRAAVPKLLDLARSNSTSARAAALTALSQLADGSQLAALVQLVLDAKEAADRDQAAEALNTAYQRIQAQTGHVDGRPLAQAAETAPTEARIVLLSLCSGLNDPAIRDAIRGGLKDSDAKVSTAAARALSDTADPELLPDLLQLAHSTQDESVRSFAINGAVRLVTQEDSIKLAPAERVSALKALLNVAAQTEQRRKVLAGLGEVPDVESLRVVQAAVGDQSVCNEAARALIKIAGGLPSSQADSCLAAIHEALKAPTDSATHQALEATVNQLQETAEYITAWEVAGPYRQAEKDYAALFDIAFAPEIQGSDESKWKAIAAGTDPKRPYVLDLLKPLGGLNCVAYARTWLHSDRDRDVLFEFGSDDGIKIWLNDKQVYALNVARPLQPGSDKVKVSLHAGWNPLLLKITQNNQGWEFCLRVRNPDGSHAEGIHCDSTPHSDSASK